MDKDLEVTISLRNNKLKAARLRLGLSQVALGKKLGLTGHTISAAECMRMRYVSKRSRKILAAFVGLPVEEVFPEWMEYLKTNRSTREMNIEELPLVQGQIENLLMGKIPLDPEEQYIYEESATRIIKKIEIIEEHRPEYIKALKGRVLDDKTLKELADECGLSYESMRRHLLYVYGYLYRGWPVRKNDGKYLLLGDPEEIYDGF